MVSRWTLDSIAELDEMLRSWEPWRSFGRSSRLASPGLLESQSAYPAVNVTSDDDNFYLDALIPGVDPDSLEVTVTGNRVSISGEKEADELGDGERYHRRERMAGKFSRTFEVSAEIDADKVKADYHNGVLHLTLPKHAKAKPRQISVDAN